MAAKYYVVWVGRQTGIFTDWPSAQRAVHGVAGARHRSFSTREAAEHAWQNGPDGSLNATSTSHQNRRKREASQSPSAAVSAISNTASAVSIFCDGACEPNPGEAGSGLAVYRHGVLSELWYGLYTPAGTNNTAELGALLQGLKMAETMRVAGDTVQIVCDSQYAMQCIRDWAPGWERLGWQRKQGTISNLSLIQAAYGIYTQLEGTVPLNYVAGHAGIEGNELADRMAMHAIATRQIDLVRFATLDIPTILSMRRG